MQLKNASESKTTFPSIIVGDALREWCCGFQVRSLNYESFHKCSAFKLMCQEILENIWTYDIIYALVQPTHVLLFFQLPSWLTFSFKTLLNYVMLCSRSRRKRRKIYEIAFLLHIRNASAEYAMWLVVGRSESGLQRKLFFDSAQTFPKLKKL